MVRVIGRLDASALELFWTNAPLSGRIRREELTSKKFKARSTSPDRRCVERSRLASEYYYATGSLADHRALIKAATTAQLARAARHCRPREIPDGSAVKNLVASEMSR
jgi:hypothetical protein